MPERVTERIKSLVEKNTNITMFDDLTIIPLDLISSIFPITPKIKEISYQN
jgi:hypothetical protein